MQSLLAEIRACQICRAQLPHGCRPIVQFSETSRILVIGQAPGRRVHESGVPWDDASGDTLRTWLGVEKGVFYDPAVFALMPMGFCFPGSGKMGDQPPRPECAPTWHARILGNMTDVRLTLLIGQYAQAYYLKENTARNLTETVRAWPHFLEKNVLSLPHPSPLNFRWLAKNRWFEAELLPDLRREVAAALFKN